MISDNKRATRYQRLVEKSEELDVLAANLGREPWTPERSEAVHELCAEAEEILVSQAVAASLCHL